MDIVGGGGGGAGDRINVTGTFLVYQVPTLMVMVPLYVPAASPLVLTATVIVALVVMDVVVGDTVSQVALSEVVSVAGLDWVLLTVNVWFGGFVAP
ncbi:MAG: hypothetical protein CV081_12995 [Nitrospira sp. LK265]|nr:hypothetical protein [Nitrospira sp. LK265]